MRRIPGKIFVTMLLALLPLLAGGVQVSVDKQEVVRGDTVTFSITAHGSDVKFPTVRQIGGFPVLGTATRSNIAIVNGGRVDKSFTKSFTFAPMKSVTIPPMKVTVDGQTVMTDPIEVKVSDAPAPSAASGGNGPALTLSLSKTHARVGEPLQLEVRLRYPRNAHYAQVDLPTPEFPNFWIKPVGDATRRIEGESVVETRRYLLFPQKAGRYTLGPVTARIARRVRVKPPINDPFFNDDFFNDFFARLEWSRIASDSLTVDVDPLPGGVDLYGDFSIRVKADKREAEADKPVRFTITVEGEGNVEDIPKFEPDIPDAVVYADEPQVKEWLKNGAYGGTFTQNVTVVAERDFTFPSLTLRYYDPKTGKVVEKKTAPIAVKVKGGKSRAAASVAAPQTKEPGGPGGGVGATRQAASAAVGAPGSALPLWAVIALVAAGAAAGAGAVAGWQRLRRAGTRKKTVPAARRIRKARSDRELFDLLLPYAKEDPDIERAVKALEENLYGGAKHRIDKELMAQIVEELEEERPAA